MTFPALDHSIPRFSTTLNVTFDKTVFIAHVDDKGMVIQEPFLGRNTARAFFVGLGTVRKLEFGVDANFSTVFGVTDEPGRE